MKDKKRRVADLMASVSGVLVFLSLAYFIDLNGFSNFAPLLMVVGLIILFWPEKIEEQLAPLKFVSRPILLTISHVLVFIGLKTYLVPHVDNWWILFFVVGVILLNTNKVFAERLFRR